MYTADAILGAFWMPDAGSTHAGDVDPLFHFILWLSVFFFALILVLMVLFIWKYRHRTGYTQQASTSHNNRLELTWTIIPSVLVVIIFYYGFRGYLHMAVIPPNAYEIQANARMWTWAFVYPNGHVDTELHVPVDRPVRLVLSSEDVIHSLYIPQFRIKKDAVPGRYNKLWFQAKQTGKFDIYCAEYCGTNHSQMLTHVVVHDSTGFEKWLEEASKSTTPLTPEGGRMLYSKLNCVQCHSLDGTRIIGPSFRDMYGSTRRFSDGSSVVADEDYVRESILEPQKKIVAGYGKEMPTFKGMVQEQDIQAITLFLKSISSHYSGPTTTTRPAQ